MTPTQKPIADNATEFGHTSSQKKIALYVDGGNFYHMSMTALGWRVNPVKIVEWLNANKGTVVTARYYLSTPNYFCRPLQFYIRFLSSRFQVVPKPVKLITREDGTSFEKADMDVEMAVDATKHIASHDVTVLVSGDSDFEYLAQEVTRAGKEIVVLSTRKMISHELRAAAGANYVDFEDIRHAVEYVPRKKAQPPKNDAQNKISKTLTGERNVD